MVSALFAAKPELRQRTWRASDDPEVDVLVARTDGGVIAVEVTRLHPNGGQDARRWEATQEKVVERAALAYEERGLPDLDVVVFWNEWTDPTKHRQTKLAADLVEFVAANVPEEGEAVGFEVGDDAGAELPYGVDAIEIRRLGDFPNHWHSPRSAFPPHVSVQEIEERLAAKDAKPRKYRRVYDERWVLLVVGGEGRSTWGIIPPTLDHHRFMSSFDRAFVVRPPREAVELQLSHTIE
jgi:hypothetical protein